MEARYDYKLFADLVIALANGAHLVLLTKVNFVRLRKLLDRQCIQELFGHRLKHFFIQVGEVGDFIL